MTGLNQRMETARLSLRAPRPDDADAIFAFASDPEVTRFVGWPRHESRAATRAFLEFSAAEWERWPAGPLVIESRDGGDVIGSTGLAFETPYRATTGYVLAKRYWGRGFATESLTAVLAVAEKLGVQRLFAHCHAEHAASARVLERCGFALEGTLRRYLVFPNLDAARAQDVLCYARVF